MNDAGMDRRAFLGACSILASALTACSSLSDRTRIASTFIVDPPAGDYMPTMRSLIRLMLPFDRPEFPLDPIGVEARLLALFPLEQERMFLGLQRTLVYFNELELIPHTAQVLLEEERKAADCPGRISRSEFQRRIRDKIARESSAFGCFLDSLAGPVRRFVNLDEKAQREYFDLWRNSELVIKREFASGLRYLVLVTAYSDERVWPAIGYDGPFVPRVRKGGA